MKTERKYGTIGRSRPDAEIGSESPTVLFGIGRLEKEREEKNKEKGGTCGSSCDCHNKAA
jgi:hypothetical protein